MIRVTPDIIDPLSQLLLAGVVAVRGIPLELGVHLEDSVSQLFYRAVVGDGADEPLAVRGEDLQSEFPGGTVC